MIEPVVENGTVTSVIVTNSGSGFVKTTNEKIKDRLLGLFYRHTKDTDLDLSDRDFVLQLFERYHKYLQQEIVDVGE